jgi:hypothetical protein
VDTTVAAEQAAVDGGRWRISLHAWAERERARKSLAEGANERGEVGEQGVGLKRGADVAGERADMSASTAGRSWARGYGRLTGGDSGTERERERERRERERMGAGEKNGADSSAPQSSEREGG